jgi:uncharacterized protein YprB with RNaseH-like and TPR domain
LVAAPPAPGVAARSDRDLAPLAIAFDARDCGSQGATPIGPVWEVRPSLAELLADYPERCERLTALGGEPHLLLDIETAGLAAAPLFLIGLLEVRPGQMTLAQLLARDYSEEAAALHAFAELAATYPRWISFNGASFDLPYLADRCAYHRLPSLVPRDHLDLLPLARRRWRGATSDCRLQTLEREVCGRLRLGDVPGEAIPDLYHEFVRDGNWQVLAPVLHHNALDLLTQAEVWAELGGVDS